MRLASSLSTVLAASMLLPPAAVAAPAQPPGDATEDTETAEAEAPAPDIDEAQRLFQEGNAKFETGDFAGAAADLQQAFRAVPLEAFHAPTRALVLMSAVGAHEQAFAGSKDPEHLVQAQAMLAAFEANPAGAGEAALGEAREARERVTLALSVHRANEAEARGREAFDAGAYADALAAYEEAQDIHRTEARLKLIAEAYQGMGENQKALDTYREYLKSDPQDRDAVTRQILTLETILNQRQPEAEAQPAAPAPAPAPVEEDKPPMDRGTKVLFISGGVATGLGVGLLGAMAAGLAMGQAADRKGQDAVDEGSSVDGILDDGLVANRLALGAGIAGGVVTAAGIALLAVAGAKRKRQLALSPAAGQHFAGIVWSGRF